VALTSWSNSNYLRRTSQVLDTYPLLISGWFYWATLPGADTGVICAVGVSTSGDNQRRLNSQASATPEAFSRSTSNASAAATAAASATTWAHAFAEFISTSSRACLLNGANRNSDTTAISPTASDSVYIGVNTTAAANAFQAAGGLAEISIWDGTGMTSGNMDSLASKLALGGNPLNITAESGQPWTAKLVAYWKLLNTTDLNDYSGNAFDLTMIGTLTNAASHPVIDPFPLPSGLAKSYFNRFPKPLFRQPIEQGRLL